MILCGFHGFLGDLVPLSWFSIDFIDFRWFYVGLCGFHRFLGPEVGHPVAGCGGILRRSLDPIVSLQDQILDNFDDWWLDDSMHRAWKPGIIKAGSSDGDFHGFRCNWRICAAQLYYFLWISSILIIWNWFVWISWIPGGSGVTGLIIYGFHRF